MRVLLDECLPFRVRPLLVGHDAYTVAFMGWKGIKNGRLLTLASAEGFDAVLTVDQSVPAQQPDPLPVALVVLRAKSNAYDDILPLIPETLDVLAALRPRSVHWVG